MDVAREIETRYKVPRTLLGLLAIIFGILIIIFPPILAWVIGIFLIIWGIMEAIRLANTNRPITTTTTR